MTFPACAMHQERAEKIDKATELPLIGGDVNHPKFEHVSIETNWIKWCIPHLKEPPQ